MVVVEFGVCLRTCDAIVKLYASFAFLRIALPNVGVFKMSAGLSGVCKHVIVASSKPLPLLIMSTQYMTELVPFDLFIAISGRSFMNVAVCAPLVQNLDGVLTAWCFIPTQWFTSKLSSDNPSRPRASLPKLLGKFEIHVSELRSVRAVNQLLLRYGRRRRTAQRITKMFFYVVSYLSSMSFRNPVHYSIDFVISFCCLWGRTNPTCTLQASVSRLRCLFAQGSVKTGGCISAILGVFNAAK